MTSLTRCIKVWIGLLLTSIAAQSQVLSDTGEWIEGKVCKYGKLPFAGVFANYDARSGCSKACIRYDRCKYAYLHYASEKTWYCYQASAKCGGDFGSNPKYSVWVRPVSPTMIPTTPPSYSPTESRTLPPTMSPTKTPTTSPTNAQNQVQSDTGEWIEGKVCRSGTLGPAFSNSDDARSACSKACIGNDKCKYAYLYIPWNKKSECYLASAKCGGNFFSHPSYSIWIRPVSPTMIPTTPPSYSPIGSPTVTPTMSPTIAPTTSPTNSPTMIPTTPPSHSPTESPTVIPTMSPSTTPTTSPTNSPSVTRGSCNKKLRWTRKIARKNCPTMISNKIFGVKACKSSYQHRLDLSLANRLYVSCKSKCVYDYNTIIAGRKGAFRYRRCSKCYKYVTRGRCFRMKKKYGAAMKRANKLC